MKKYYPFAIIILSGLLLAGLIYFYISAKERPVPGQIGLEQAVSYNRAEPSGKEYYDTVYAFKKKVFDPGEGTVSAAIVPHHLLAGDMIAEFYSNLEGRNYDSVVVIGPNHFLAGKAELVTSVYDWQTPFGELAVDRELLERLEKDYPDLGIEPKVVEAEHAITSQAGFIKKTFPKARFLPLVLHPNIRAEAAENLAKALTAANGDKRLLVIASVDFAHNVNSEEAQIADKSSIEVLTNSDLGEVYRIEVDSPPAVYTAMRYARLNKAAFELLNNSNSALLSGNPETKDATSYITGYFISE